MSHILFKKPASVFYPVGGSTFDGTAAYMSRGGDLTGSPDLSRGTMSFWFKRQQTGSFSADLIFNNSIAGDDNGSIRVGIQNNALGSNLDRMFFNARQFGGPAGNFTLQSSVLLSTSPRWYPCLISWDTNFSAGNKLKGMYIDDANALNSTSDSLAAITPNTSTNWQVGEDARSGTQYYTGSLAELYVMFGTYTDFSVLANRRKFISATRRPIFLGSDGSRPLGTQPHVYLKGSGTGFNVNSGSGGNFTTVGTPTTPTTTPST